MVKSTKTKQTDQDKLLLAVIPRTIFGKKLKKLRKEGIVPANIFGPEFKSQAVSLNFKDFSKIYKIAKQTGVVYLKLNSDKLPVMIKNVQRHPVNDNLLHIDFRKIDLKQKIQTDVPIKIIGQSEAVTQKGGVLLTQAESLLVEALPNDIPRQIDIDISGLKELNQEIKVSSLTKSDKFQIKENEDKIIVSVVEHKEEEILPQTAPAAAPEVITAKPEEEIAVEEQSVGEKPAAPEGKPAEAKQAKPEEKKSENKS